MEKTDWKRIGWLTAATLVLGAIIGACAGLLTLLLYGCLLYTSPSPRDISGSRMPSSA